MCERSKKHSSFAKIYYNAWKNADLQKTNFIGKYAMFVVILLRMNQNYLLVNKLE